MKISSLTCMATGLGDWLPWGLTWGSPHRIWAPHSMVASGQVGFLHGNSGLHSQVFN